MVIVMKAAIFWDIATFSLSEAPFQRNISPAPSGLKISQARNQHASRWLGRISLQSG
jgi:hypothetical protein